MPSSSLSSGGGGGGGLRPPPPPGDLAIALFDGGGFWGGAAAAALGGAATGVELTTGAGGDTGGSTISGSRERVSSGFPAACAPAFGAHGGSSGRRSCNGSSGNCKSGGRSSRGSNSGSSQPLEVEPGWIVGSEDDTPSLGLSMNKRLALYLKRCRLNFQRPAPSSWPV